MSESGIGVGQEDCLDWLEEGAALRKTLDSVREESREILERSRANCRILEEASVAMALVVPGYMRGLVGPPRLVEDVAFASWSLQSEIMQQITYYEQGAFTGRENGESGTNGTPYAREIATLAVREAMEARRYLDREEVRQAKETSYCDHEYL